MIPPCKDKIYPKDFVFVKPYGFNLLSTFANPPNRREMLSTFATHPSTHTSNHPSTLLSARWRQLNVWTFNWYKKKAHLKPLGFIELRSTPTEKNHCQKHFKNTIENKKWLMLEEQDKVLRSYFAQKGGTRGQRGGGTHGQGREHVKWDMYVW